MDVQLCVKSARTKTNRYIGTSVFLTIMYNGRLLQRKTKYQW